MARKTVLYLILSAFIFFSCATDSETTESKSGDSTNTEESGIRFNISELKNLVIGKSSTSGSNSLESNDLSSNSILTYNNSGDLVTVSTVINEDVFPSEFLRVNTNDYKAIKYTSEVVDAEVYLVAPDGLGIGLSQFGLPSINSGTKNKPQIYKRNNKFYYLSNNDLLEIVLNNSGGGTKTVLASSVSGFDVRDNFIYYKSSGQFVLKNNGDLKQLNDDFNAEFSNFVFRSKENCLIAKTSLSSLKEYQELCIDEDGIEVIRDARSGYNECRNDPSLPAFCQGAVQEFGIINSLSSCAEVGIGDGFLVCRNSTRPVFFELENSIRHQIELITSMPDHKIINLVFDFDSSFLYMISGNDGSLKFSKIDIVNKTFIDIAFSYTKPSWVVYCNNKLTISVDDKIVDYLSDGTLIEIGSNAGIEEYECMD